MGLLQHTKLRKTHSTLTRLNAAHKIPERFCGPFHLLYVYFTQHVPKNNCTMIHVLRRFRDNLMHPCRVCRDVCKAVVVHPMIGMILDCTRLFYALLDCLRL